MEVGDNCSCPVGFTPEAAGCKGDTSLVLEKCVRRDTICSAVNVNWMACYLVCADVDECADEEPGLCGPHAVCVNTPGSYSCNCLHGFLMGAAGCQGLLASMCKSERLCIWSFLKIKQYVICFFKCRYR